MNYPSPGSVLLEQLIKPLKISIPKLAEALDVPPNRLYAIINGSREISIDTAHRLGHFFETGADFWLSLQQNHDKAAFKTTWQQLQQKLPRYSSWQKKINAFYK